jgi:hypothetical protein
MDNYLVSFLASRKILLRILFGYTQNKIRGPPFWSLDLYLFSYSGRRRWSTRQLLLLCYIDKDDDGRFIFVWLYTHINDKI